MLAREGLGVPRRELLEDEARVPAARGRRPPPTTTTTTTTTSPTITTMITARTWCLGWKETWWPRATTTWGPLWGGSRRSRPRLTPTNRPRSTGDGLLRGLEARQARDRSRAKRPPPRPGPRPTPRRLQFSSNARPRQI